MNLVESKFQPDVRISEKDLPGLLEELYEAPGDNRHKYVAYVVVSGMGWLYRMTNIPDHATACTMALNAHKASGRPSSGVMRCTVIGQCNDVSCDCGGKLRGAGYIGITLGKP